MALITFLNTDRLSLATSRLVYEPGEIDSLTSVLDQAEKLRVVIDSEGDKIQAATEQGYSEGYEKGQDEGYEAALEHIATKLVVLSKEAANQREKLEQETGSLAIKIVEKIATEVGSHEMIVALAKSAAAEMLPRELIVLRVHPEAHSAVSQQVLNPDQKYSRIVEVIADPELEEEDCILESEYGHIKADLKTQLKVIHERLYGTA